MSQKFNSRLWFTVAVSALGYLVDVYDIMIFSVVRVPSLRDIGVPESEWTRVGLNILNWQMVGMLLGGLLWGMIGDKKGRLTVLFGSILMYSTASLLNLFVTDATQYTVLRFIAGFGLAGEFGAGVTLASELLPSRSRGYGTMVIAAIGVLGAILAGLMGQIASWKTCYLLGAMMGFGLLLIRFSALESGLFEKLKVASERRGDLRQLFGRRDLLFRYLRCLFLAVPAWMQMGLFTTLAPELSAELGLREPLTSGQALLYLSLGIGLGDLSSSWVSQKLKSRKQTLALYLILLFISALFFGWVNFQEAQSFLILYAALGLCAGYWAVFMMTTAEQFGTNLRATVSISTPNFVRAMVVPLSFALEGLRPALGLRHALTLMTLMMIGVAFLCLRWMRETFSEDLDFVD